MARVRRESQIQSAILVISRIGNSTNRLYDPVGRKILVEKSERKRAWESNEQDVKTVKTKIRLTRELIHSAGSYGGHGFNRQQLNLLNVNWPPKSGWIAWLEGKEIPFEIWQQVLNLKGKTRKRLRQESNPNRF